MARWIKPNPVLALVGAVVLIDTIAAPETITRVLRRNRAESLIGILWLTVHVCKAG